MGCEETVGDGHCQRGFTAGGDLPEEARTQRWTPIVCVWWFGWAGQGRDAFKGKEKQIHNVEEVDQTLASPEDKHNLIINVDLAPGCSQHKGCNANLGKTRRERRDMLLEGGCCGWNNKYKYFHSHWWCPSGSSRSRGGQWERWGWVRAPLASLWQGNSWDWGSWMALCCIQVLLVESNESILILPRIFNEQNILNFGASEKLK